MFIPSAFCLIILLPVAAYSNPSSPRLLGDRNTRLGELYRGPVALSSDGSRALAATADGRVEILDPVTRRVLSSHRPPFEAETIEFLGGDRLMGSGKNGLTASWDAETGGSSLTLRLHGAEYRSPVSSADGRRIAFTDDEGVITIVDAIAGGKLADLGRPSDDFDRRPWVLALSPDGKRAASGDGAGNVAIWDVDAAKIAWSTAAFSGRRDMVSSGVMGPHYGPPDAAASFAFSPNGRLVAVCGREGELLVFDAASGRLLLRDAASSPLTFHPDGRSLFAGIRGGGLKRIRVPGGGAVFSNAGKTDYSDISISTDGLRIVALENGRYLAALDARTGLAVGTGTTRSVWRAEYSRDGKLLASGGNDGIVEIYSMPKGERLLRIKAHQESVRMLAFSPDASLLATIGHDETLRVWNAVSGRKVWEAAYKSISFADRFAFAPDGGSLIVGDKKALVVWSARSGKRLKEFAGHPGEVENVIISRDGRYAATGCNDSRLRLWNIRSGKLLFAQPAAASRWSWTLDLAFTSDGRQLVGRDRNGDRVFRFSVPDGRLLETIALDRNVRGTILSVDGRLAITQNDGTRTGWSAFLLAPNGERTMVFQGQPGLGEMLALSPDGKQMVTSADDGLLRVWSVPP